MSVGRIMGNQNEWTFGHVDERGGDRLPRHFGARSQRSEQVRLELVAMRHHGSLAKASDTKWCLRRLIWWQIVLGPHSEI